MSIQRQDLHNSTRRWFVRGSAFATLGALCGVSRLATAAPTARTTSKTPLTKRGTAATPRATAVPKGGLANAAPTLLAFDTVLSAQEKAMGDAIADAVNHAAAIAVKQPSSASFAPGGYASIAQTFAKQMPSKSRAASAKRARRMLRAPASKRRIRFGAFAASRAAVHNTTIRPVSQQLARAATDTLIKKYRVASKAPPKGMVKLPKSYTKVGFFLNEVKCREETDEIGADQIRLGGIAVSPNGDIKKIKSFMVSSDFDEGETRSYYPPGHSKFNPNDPFRGRHLASFDLASASTAGAYPAGYAIAVIMVEEDSGGFSEMLEGLWSAVAKEVKDSIAVVSAVLGGVYGQIIGNITGYVLDKVIGFLAQLFDNPDDYVDRVEGFLGLSSPHEEYFAALTGRESHAPPSVWAAKRQTWKFKGDGGYYRAKAHWRVW